MAMQSVLPCLLTHSRMLKLHNNVVAYASQYNATKCVSIRSKARRLAQSRQARKELQKNRATNSFLSLRENLISLMIWTLKNDLNSYQSAMVFFIMLSL
jgi:hypothetical protein